MDNYEITNTDSFVSKNNNLVIRWGAKNIGFGETCLSFDKKSGKIFIDSEMMSREFIKSVFNKMIDDAVFTDLETLEKNTKELSLEELNSRFPFQEHILLLPFYFESEGNTTQYRWHLDKNVVINVWLTGEEENIFTLSQKIQAEKTFPNNFLKAEIWHWTTKSKKN